MALGVCRSRQVEDAVRISKRNDGRHWNSCDDEVKGATRRAFHIESKMTFYIIYWKGLLGWYRHTGL